MTCRSEQAHTHALPVTQTARVVVRTLPKKNRSARMGGSGSGRRPAPKPSTSNPKTSVLARMFQAAPGGNTNPQAQQPQLRTGEPSAPTPAASVVPVPAVAVAIEPAPVQTTSGGAHSGGPHAVPQAATSSLTGASQTPRPRVSFPTIFYPGASRVRGFWNASIFLITRSASHLLCRRVVAFRAAASGRRLTATA